MNGKVVSSPPLPWVKLYPQTWYATLRELEGTRGRDAAFSWVRETIDGLATGVRVEGSVADELIREAQSLIDQRREAGARGGRASAIKRSSGASSIASSGASTRRKTKEERRKKKIEEGRGESVNEDAHGPHRGQDGADVSVSFTPPKPPKPPSLKDARTLQRETFGAFLENPYEQIENLPDILLPDALALYCGEPNNRQAANSYAKYIRTHGKDAFIERARAFFDGIALGREPDSRGKVFMASLREGEPSHE